MASKQKAIVGKKCECVCCASAFVACLLLSAPHRPWKRICWKMDLSSPFISWLCFFAAKDEGALALAEAATKEDNCIMYVCVQPFDQCMARPIGTQFLDWSRRPYCRRSNYTRVSRAPKKVPTQDDDVVCLPLPPPSR